MAIFQQATGGFSAVAGTTLGQAYGSATKVKSLLVCCADSSTPGGVQTVSDTVNGSWTAVPNGKATDGSRDAQIFYFLGATGGTPTVNLSLVSSANYRALMIAEYSDVTTLDTGANSTGSSAAPSVVVPINVPSSNVAVAGTFGVNTVTSTNGNDRVNDNGDHFVDFLNSALGNLTFTFTMTAGGWSVAGASFLSYPVISQAYNAIPFMGGH